MAAVTMAAAVLENDLFLIYSCVVLLNVHFQRSYNVYVGVGEDLLEVYIHKVSRLLFSMHKIKFGN